MGQMFDAEQISVTEKGSFQWSNKPIAVLEAMNENSCLLRKTELPNVVQISKGGKKYKQFSVYVNDVCVTDNNEVYVTDYKNKSISRLSLSGSVSPVFSTDPLKPGGICQSKDGGLLVTLTDTKSDR